MNEENYLPDDPDDLELNYNPIHGLSIVACPLAFFGILVIAFPVLIVINLLAATLAIVSILQITKSERFVGIKVAKFALFLALLPAVLSTVHQFGRSWYLNQTAHEFSMQIAHLIMEGRYGEAFEYSVTPNARQPEGTDLTEYYRGTNQDQPNRPPPSMELRMWLAAPPLEIIEKDRRRGSLQFLGFREYKKLKDPFWEPLGCVYKYEPASPELDASTFQMVMLRKTSKNSSDVSWRLFLFDVLEGPRMDVRKMNIGGPPDETTESIGESVGN